MTKLSPEEKRKEASDWTKGLVGLAIVLGIILIGYIVFQGVKNNLLQQQAQKGKYQRITQAPEHNHIADIFVFTQ